MSDASRRQYRFEGYVLDGQSGKLFSPAGAPLLLSARAFAVLEALVAAQGEIIAKAALLEAAWPDVVVEENNLNQAISLIRKALGDSKSASRFIQTIPNRGYRFIAAVAAVTQSAQTPPVTAAVTSPTVALEPHASAGNRRRERGLRRALLPGLAFAGIGVLLLASFWLYRDHDVASRALPTPASLPTLAASPAVPLVDDSVAVLPFTQLNEAEDGALFAFGLQDEIIHQLAKIRGLNVIARNSVATLTQEAHAPEEIGRRLGAEALISGTLLFRGDEVRVSVQMVEAQSGIILWASTYDAQRGRLDELVTLYRDVALNASKALQVDVASDERQALGVLPTASFAAYRYNLAANAAYHNLDYPSAWQLSKQAITLDPYYYEALYTFASVNTVLIGTPFPGTGTQEHYEMAMEAAQSMIAVAPARTEGHALKAALHSTQGEWLAVADELQELRKLDASLSDMRFVASVLLCVGDFEGAIAILEANLKVEPVNLYARGFLMLALELAGHRLQARQEYELGDALTPYWWGDSVEIFLALGRREPLQDIDELYGISDELKALLHGLNAEDGDLEPALQRYRDSATKSAVESLFHGAVAARLGFQELALEFMTLAVHDSRLNMHWLWLPVFDDLRRLEGFRTLLLDSGIAEYWDRFGWPELCRKEEHSFTCDWTAYPRAH